MAHLPPGTFSLLSELYRQRQTVLHDLVWTVSVSGGVFFLFRSLVRVGQYVAYHH